MGQAGKFDSGNVETALGVQNGKVVLRYHQPVVEVHFDPQNAFVLAEHLARAAHEARFGETPPDANGKYLAAQIRARVKEDLHGRMVARARLSLKSLIEQGKPIDYIAREVVDTILSQAT